MDNFVLDFFKANDVKYAENYPMSRLTPIKIGGECELAVFPDSEKKLTSTVKFLSTNSLKYKVVGKMSNILPTDTRYGGVIVLTGGVKSFAVDGEAVTLSAGATLRGALPRLLEGSLSGYEELLGIPGCIGGLICGNAGAFSRDISQLVKSVRALELNTFDEVTLYPSELGFSYRDSIFKRLDYLILSAELSLAHSDKTRIRARIQDCKAHRAQAQPIEYPSLGSTFKRAGNKSAAELIDRCGLKGSRVGGAMISQKHAGFIINLGNAAASDVMALADIAADAVFAEYGVRLEREIEYLGA